MADKDYSIEELFKALADRTRLRVINLLGDDEVCVQGSCESFDAAVVQRMSVPDVWRW